MVTLHTYISSNDTSTCEITVKPGGNQCSKQLTRVRHQKHSFIPERNINNLQTRFPELLQARRTAVIQKSNIFPLEVQIFSYFFYYNNEARPKDQSRVSIILKESFNYQSTDIHDWGH